MNLHSPLVSVVMPSYNHEKYLPQSVESVLNQDYKNIQLIIVDDCSTDSSREIVKHYASIDDRIVPLYHERNFGIARTLNDGLRLVKGDYLAFLGSDDLWYVDKLTRELKEVNGDKSVIVWSEGDVIDSEGNNLNMKFVDDLHHATERQKEGDIVKEILKGFFIFGQSVLIPKELLQGISFNEDFRYYNDYLFYLYVFSNGKAKYIPEPTAAYRIHGNNSILSNRELWAVDTLNLAQYIFDYFYEHLDAYTKAYWSLHYFNSLRQIQTRKNYLVTGLKKFSRHVFTLSALRIVLRALQRKKHSNNVQLRLSSIR